MIIEFIYEVVEFKLENEITYRKWLREIAENENRIIGIIKFIFVNEEKIIDINTKFLKHNYSTDIITFDNSFLNSVSGEIFICIPSVKRNCFLYSKGMFYNELNRVIVHGILHLIGFNDKSEEEIEIMRKKEDLYLKDLD